MSVVAMGALEAAAWGLLGGFIVEALEYSAAIRRTKGWPWRRRGEPGLGPSLVAIALRLSASAGLAAAAGAGGQVAGAFGALALGITAPLVVEKILQQAATRSVDVGAAQPLAAGEREASDAP
ncbi:hypothetical protein BJY16_006008 [Actinoplanes octamycinicus]|uniref:Uncharacterized protein n=1 Tax=Actinoplanes octamycinicus TaxID=135948 RepID=A0A7W7MA08_9ACTN|nr:hypothetical protein [Actinoplanes octamycinicus]MBB4742549.1 hypothetical protein [Actinoplanes octamycinicus]GIE60886.1 hypothetical protein Aoc01nite_62880 [Actinoplanes octamycinicus]